MPLRFGNQGVRAVPVCPARSATKTYRSGEVEVPALRGIDLGLYRPHPLP